MYCVELTDEQVERGDLELYDIEIEEEGEFFNDDDMVLELEIEDEIEGEDLEYEDEVILFEEQIEIDVKELEEEFKFEEVEIIVIEDLEELDLEDIKIEIIDESKSKEDIEIIEEIIEDDVKVLPLEDFTEEAEEIFVEEVVAEQVEELEEKIEEIVEIPVIEKDLTEEEAEERAEEIGCVGTHSHETDDGTIFMPCASHADYERLTGDELTTPKQDPRYGEGSDVFDTQPEAERRARRLGCDGTHTIKGPDGNVYMPCSSHAIYLRVTGKKDEELGDDAKAESDVDTKPTEQMAKEAERGLAMRKEFNRGGTEVGVARAVQLVSRENLSPRTVRHM